MKTPEHILKYFADFIFSELGIVYQEANFYQLETRLNDIAKQKELESIEDLWTLARRHMTNDLKMLILDVATNNETSFFRDPNVFKAIEEHFSNGIVFPHYRQSPLRVWSAACSFGQEIYSLSMLFEKIKAKLPGGDYQILATDVSHRALAKAKEGVFTQLEVQRGLPAPMLVRYFEKKGDNPASLEWHVKDELKKNVTFRTQNLLAPFGAMGPFDLVMCRNVLIYQKVERKKEILHRIHDVMEHSGCLVLGAAESLIGITDRFQTLKAPKATLYQKPEIISKAS